jgi:polysaccharide chain length determinant protein (PEP-CTERM system associated)
MVPANWGFQDYLNIARRRWFLIMGTAVLSVSVAVALCAILPKTYRSTTVILVENQKVPERYVQGVVSGTVQERVAMIQQQVLSRTTLSAVIKEFNLVHTEEPLSDLDEAIREMRKAIKVDTRGGGQVESFSLSYAHRDPYVAMKVTARLASRFIEENLRIREEFVAGASEFLQQELQTAKETLEAKERAIGEFKREHMGELPGQLDANQRTLDRLQMELASNRRLLAGLNDRLGIIEATIGEYSSAATSEQLTAKRRLMQQEREVDEPIRIKQLEQQLAELLSEYKDTYPDVIAVKKELQKLRGRGSSPPRPPKGAELVQGDQIAKPVDPHIQKLVRERDEAKIEIKTLKTRQEEIVDEMKKYQGRVERTPSREQELALLLRDYENMQKNYQSLLDKHLNARVAENLERRQKGEQFRVLDPANLPTKPESPNVVMVLAAGLFLGLGGGCGGAIALDLLRPALRRPEEVENLLGIPVFATIPLFQTAYQSQGPGVPSRQQPTPCLLPWRQPVPAGGEQRRGSATGEDRNCEVQREKNLVTLWRPMSVVAEQFRVAATNIALLTTTRKSTVILITSAMQGEGKSSTASNLAYVMAQDLGKATLLIDGDFKRPRLHEYTGCPLKPGLADVMCGEETLDRCLRPVNGSTLQFLAAGTRKERPLGLSKIQTLAGLLTELKTRFEYIVLDTPPVLPLADVNVLSGMADVLLLIVRSGVSHPDAVKKAIKALKPTVQAGAILTGHATREMPYYMRHYYYAKPEV